MLIRLTDRAKAVRESFWDAELQVDSRSGLNITEKVLLEQLPLVKAEQSSVLCLGNRSGVLPIAISTLWPNCKVYLHYRDVFYHKKVESILKQNQRLGAIESLCTADLEFLESSFDFIYIQATQSLAAELLYEDLFKVYSYLKPDGKCWVACDKQHKTVSKSLKEVFGSVSDLSKKTKLYVSKKKKKEAKKNKSFEASFKMSLPSGLELALKTQPGVFSHRRVDGGALALSESIVSKEDDSILDMGCGCGAIGISVAKQLKNYELRFIDSNARALKMTEINCRENKVEVTELILSASGDCLESCATLFVGNPPYFSDHKISALFIDTAYRALKANGRMYLVAKKMEWNENYAKKNFKNIQIKKRRNYMILSAIRP